MTANPLLIGSANPKKLGELEAILGNRLPVVSLHNWPQITEPAETESTLEGNAVLKARYYHAQTGLPCLSDDTGLEVAALNGAPGVYSARYAGPENNAEANMRKLLTALEGVTERQACFRTVLAYVDAQGELHTFVGELRGIIGTEPRGSFGFGYDPIFIPEGESRTLAELEPEVKKQMSHRARALQAFAQFIERQ